MKIGKLLGAGKSFVNGGKVVAYRENKRAYLPKFISPKNPFTPKAPEQNSPTLVPAQKIIAPTQTEKIPVFSGPMRATNWAEKLNPFRSTKPTAAQFTVQPELSLNTVKVVQNDLTDADVEIVPMKSHPAQTAQTAEMNLSAAREPWEFLGERLLNSF